ncbi:MAG: hypothetical protein QOD10_4771 [Mycobacterium sp.]|nr:hypothetical protein [Mycobacterium sp.]
MSDGPSDIPLSDPVPDQPRIRRQSDGATPSAPQPAQSEPQTSIIRRHPTGELPAVAEPQTSFIASGAESQTSYIPRARPTAVGAPRSAQANPAAAIVTAIASILTGWSTAVIATDLITGWWRSDRLFCVAIGFLTAVSAAALIGGLIALLLRRRMGRLLIVVGAVVALLIFAGLFVAGAKLSPVVYAIPVLPVASVLSALLPATRRWARPQ